MIFRARLVLPLLVLFVGVLAAVALLMPVGAERLIIRATTKVESEPLRACLATRLGLTMPWQGDVRAVHASAYGLRVVVRDSGHDRLVGLFTAGGKALSDGQTAALTACIGTP